MPLNHTVRIIPYERAISAPEDISVLAAAQLAGMALPHSCRSGRCGSCRARLLSGRVEYPDGPPPGLSPQEASEGFVLLCQALARSDLVVETRLIPSPASVEIRTLPSRIVRRVPLSPDVMQLVLRLPSTESLEFQAGQYLDVLLEGGRRRSYSVANAPNAGSELELHVRHIPGGAFSEALSGSLREGAVLKIAGPLGQFRYEGGAEPAIFVAGGTGFAPLKAMLGQALGEDSGRELHLYWGARDAAGVYEAALLRDWAARHARLRIHTQSTGWVHEAVLKDHPDLAPFAIYAAGPPAMIAAIRRTFPAHGARAQLLYLESFDPATDP
jgi:CDP-4-dehydro-6-deoxyglucose reductase